MWITAIIVLSFFALTTGVGNKNNNSSIYASQLELLFEWSTLRFQGQDDQGEEGGRVDAILGSIRVYGDKVGEHFDRN